MAILNHDTHILTPDFESLQELPYCVEEIDEGSKVKGTFAYDPHMATLGLGHWAITPVFSDVQEFYEWAKDLGFKFHAYTGGFVLLKECPV